MAEKNTSLPKGFLFGTSSAAHQVEGENISSDWWHYERIGRLPKSGKCADHFHRFREDFSLAAGCGMDVMRISIEWSRIEPEAGRWDSSAIEHYRSVLVAMRAMGLLRIVTLFHFTLPLWFYRQGGFSRKANIAYFSRFAKFIAHELGDEVDMWVTVNEPEVYAAAGFLQGSRPPFVRNPLHFWSVYRNLLDTHRAAYAAIKEGGSNTPVGVAVSAAYFTSSRRSLSAMAAAAGRQWISGIARTCDFIGLNYYFAYNLAFSLRRGIRIVNRDQPFSDMGYRAYPEGLLRVLRDFSRFGKPLYITENGIANAAEDMRVRFIVEHIEAALSAREQGVDVRGYLYWSLTDTYEWQQGFDLKFGLVEIDYSTLERKPRASYYELKRLIGSKNIH